MFSNYKSNLANKDSEGTKESVRIMRVMLKSKIRLLFHQDTTELKQDASIVKLNISKLHQAVIPRRLCPWKHSKVSTKSLIIRYVTQIYSLHNSIDVKIVKNFRPLFILSGVL